MLSGPLSVCRENCVDVTVGRINLILTVFLSILPPNLDSDYNLRGDYKKKMVKIWTDISREKGDRVSSESSFLYMKLLSFDWKSNVFFMMPMHCEIRNKLQGRVSDWIAQYLLSAIKVTRKFIKWCILDLFNTYNKLKSEMKQGWMNNVKDDWRMIKATSQVMKAGQKSYKLR